MKTIEKLKCGIAANWRRWTQTHKAQETRRREICPRCGAQITSTRLSLREKAATAVSGALLLSIVVPVCWTAEQWAERQAQRMLGRAVWHEPLGDWIRN